MSPLTKRQVASRIARLPPDMQVAAVHAFVELYGRGRDPGAQSQATRVPEQRRQYAGDPWAYFRDILGWNLTQQQDDALEMIEGHDRVLIPAANNVGKTWLLGGYGVYRMDAVAALPDEQSGLEEQGARILLPGPDHSTIQQTVYAEMLTHALRAESRGHLMPGRRSENSVLWKVRPKWEVEAFSPPASVSQKVAHTASGRHHRNQVALIEEGQGVEERVWKAVQGMCSSEGNKIISSFNPTEPVGPAHQRARSGAYQVLHMSAFGHPNVRNRENEIPDAVSFKTVDARVRSECKDRGPYPGTAPDEERGDFTYALPPDDAEERGPREDGVPGHPDGRIRVYRPEPGFTAQVLGEWPKTSDSTLFDPGAWDQAVQRWRKHPEPDEPPDRVGVDVAREGDDDSCLCPAWGETAGELLAAYAEALKVGNGAAQKIRAQRRARIGELRILRKGDGVDIAQQVAQAYPFSPYNVDEGGVGSSAYDHLTRVMDKDAHPVVFGAKAPEPTPGEPWSENLRTAMYVRAARLVNLGLADVPDDPVLREEVMAHSLKHGTMTVGRKKRKERKPSVLLSPKKDVKKEIGRSPDRADAFVMSLLQARPHPDSDSDEWTTLKDR